MSRAFLAALAASLLLHALILFSPEVPLWPRVPESQPLQARLVAAKTTLPVAPALPKKEKLRPAKSTSSSPKPPPPALPVQPEPVQPASPSADSVPDPASPNPLEPLMALPVEAGVSSDGEHPGVGWDGRFLTADTGDGNGPQVVGPLWPPQGEIQFKVYRGDRGLEVGRSLHRWETLAPREPGGDTPYRLYALTETTGLAAFLRPIRLETESFGMLTARGLVPEHFQISRDGRPTEESADFDWPAGQVRIGRKDTRYGLAPGSQDLLSFHYQFPYLGSLGGGVTFKVATGKKYEQFPFDALGEETLELPAGRFRTLHLRSLGSSLTEIWLALDQSMLPVKIRHTDRKGEVFEQVAVELHLGTPKISEF